MMSEARQIRRHGTSCQAKEAKKIPSAWNRVGSLANKMTSRGEYASALNCTTTKTMAVSAIMPELGCYA
jgi:hypothetical protein